VEDVRPGCFKTPIQKTREKSKGNMSRRTNRGFSKERERKKNGKKDGKKIISWNVSDGELH